jgi:uracil-DNA glycosylase family 4
MLETCTKCPLCQTRSQVIQGYGSGKSGIFFLDFHPSAAVDIVGEPLVDRSGQLFIKLLKQAGLDYKECYYTYIAKCFPKNTKVVNEYVDTCKSAWMMQEISAVKPSIIATLGIVPTKFLLGKKLTTSGHFKQCLGKSYEFLDTTLVVPWYSPSYILNRGVATEDETIVYLNKLKGEAKNVRKAEKMDLEAREA